MAGLFNRSLKHVAKPDRVVLEGFKQFAQDELDKWRTRDWAHMPTLSVTDYISQV